jgi:hypothetical protein
MPKFTKKASPADDLEERIKAHWRELDKLIEQHATVIAKAAGLPMINIKQQMQIRSGCLCQTAMQICLDNKRDAEISARANDAKQQPAA